MSLPPERKASHGEISVKVLGFTQISALSHEMKLRKPCIGGRDLEKISIAFAMGSAIALVVHSVDLI